MTLSRCLRIASLSIFGTPWFKRFCQRSMHARALLVSLFDTLEPDSRKKRVISRGWMGADEWMLSGDGLPSARVAIRFRIADLLGGGM